MECIVFKIGKWMQRRRWRRRRRTASQAACARAEHWPIVDGQADLEDKLHN